VFGYVTMPRLKIDGLAIIAYLCLYSVGRFFLFYLRVNQILFLGLREAQVIALITPALCMPATWHLLHRAREQRPPEAWPANVSCEGATGDGVTIAGRRRRAGRGSKGVFQESETFVLLLTRTCHFPEMD
jgi:hypothetical protein